MQPMSEEGTLDEAVHFKWFGVIHGFIGIGADFTAIIAGTGLRPMSR